MTPLLSQLKASRAPQQSLITDGKKSWSLAQVEAAADQIAQKLHELRAKRVALWTDNGADWVLVDLACQLAEILLLPLPTFFSTQQIQHALTNVAPDLLLSAQPLPGTKAKMHRLAPTSLLLQPLAANNTHVCYPKNTGKITFTSGSTGTPKGVCLSHAQQLLQAKALAQAVNLDRPRHLCVLPLSTLLENIAGLYTPWLAGGEIATPALTELGFIGSSRVDAKRFYQYLYTYSPHSLILTPQLLQLLLECARAGAPMPKSLRFIAVGGSHVPPSMIEQAHQLGLPVYQGYGLSECVSVVSLNTPADNDPGSCGRPLPHLQVSQSAGIIQVQGNSMLGYLNEPQSWSPDRIGTGDLGHLDGQGRLHISGRQKNLLISSYGRNISPEWVESEILAHPALSDCLLFGDARPYCVALIATRQEQLSDQQIQHWLDQCNTRLPDYARVQGWWRLPKPLSTQPGLLTESGKPRRAQVFARYAKEIERLYATPIYQTA